MQNNTITGNASALCNLPRIHTLVSDCSGTGTVAAEYECSCCTRCCPSPQCNDAWLNSEAKFIRNEYDRSSFAPAPVTERAGA